MACCGDKASGGNIYEVGCNQISILYSITLFNLILISFFCGLLLLLLAFPFILASLIHPSLNYPSRFLLSVAVLLFKQVDPMLKKMRIIKPELKYNLSSKLFSRSAELAGIFYKYFDAIIFFLILTTAGLAIGFLAS